MRVLKTAAVSAVLAVGVCLFHMLWTMAVIAGGR